jgi:hypothetical protein
MTMHDRPSSSARVAAQAAHAAAHAAGAAKAAQARHAAAKAASTATTGGTSFSDLLAGAGNAPTASAAPTPATTTPAAAGGRSPIHLHKGETMTAVANHQYGEIHGGKRDGMFVNTSGNKRRGEAFTIVTRAGKELHVYGSGKDRLVVHVSPPHDPSNPPPPVKLRAGETMTPVPGHHYAEIHGGPRDGLLINTSLNHNRGKTFVAVTKDGVDYHIYGTGKDRRVVRMVPHDPGATITS